MNIVFNFDDDGDVHMLVEEGYKPSSSQYTLMIAKIIDMNSHYNTACNSGCLACDSARKLMTAIDKLAEEFVKTDPNVAMMREGPSINKH